MDYDERQLVILLAEQLHSRFGYRVYVHKKPASSPSFCERLKEELMFEPVLQPEVDIIVQDNTGKLNAIEVKLFKRKKGSYSQPFYIGIGQSLALLNYGFDHAALWFLFFEEDYRIVERAYGPSAWTLIRKKLQLPLEFSFFQVEQLTEQVGFRVMHLISESEAALGVYLNDPRFPITWKYPNPLKENPGSQMIRVAMEDYLARMKPMFG